MYVTSLIFCLSLSLGHANMIYTERTNLHMPLSANFDRQLVMTVRVMTKYHMCQQHCKECKLINIYLTWIVMARSKWNRYCTVCANVWKLWKDENKFTRTSPRELITDSAAYLQADQMEQHQTCLNQRCGQRVRHLETKHIDSWWIII